MPFVNELIIVIHTDSIKGGGFKTRLLGMRLGVEAWLSRIFNDIVHF